MPFMRWDDFRRLHPRAHLIVARDAADHAKGNIALLRLLIVELRPHGDYALQPDNGNLHLAIETDYDRDRVISLLSAKPGPSGCAWASRAVFTFDPTAWRRKLAAWSPDNS